MASLEHCQSLRSAKKLKDLHPYSFPVYSVSKLFFKNNTWAVLIRFKI